MRGCWSCADEKPNTTTVSHTHTRTPRAKSKLCFSIFATFSVAFPFGLSVQLTPLPSSHSPLVDSRPRCRLHSPFRDSLKMHSQPAAVPKETEKFKENFWVCAEFAIWPKSVRDFLCLPENFCLQQHVLWRSTRLLFLSLMLALLKLYLVQHLVRFTRTIQGVMLFKVDLTRWRHCRRDYILVILTIHRVEGYCNFVLTGIVC